MRASVRAVLRVLLLVAVLCGAGAAVATSPALASVRPATTSATPGVPTLTVKAVNGDSANVCVENFAPNSTVTVTNTADNSVAVIHTDSTGAGCTNVHLSTSCSATLHETLVASGTDAEGKPATATAIVDVPPPSTCSSSPTPTPTPTSTCDPTQATLSVYIVPQGALVRGSACGFLPGEVVDLYILSESHFEGSTHALVDGSASMLARIPNCIQPGPHTFELVGETSGHVATAQFTIEPSSACRSVAAGGGGSGTTGPGSSGPGGGVSGTHVSNQGSPAGGLAFTGANILLMLLVALVLIGLGAIAWVSVRRRRTAAAA